ncbi:MAG: hypothetical protein KJO07_19215, partial [Deltaproteobacteria bacterium]|nr:hypothetical protein [Deltaproteobacteria bacterium]
MLLSTGCVDSFSGAFVALDMRSQINENLVDAMTNPAVFGERRGGVTGPIDATPFDGVLLQHQANAPFASQAAPDTHFSLNWVESGTDEDGNSVQYTFKAIDFEIVPLVNLFDPCMIDSEPTQWPGIQAIAVQARQAEDLGFATPSDPLSIGPDDPVWADLTDNEKAQVFDQARRVDRLQSLAGRVLAVVSYDPITPAELLATQVDTVCDNDPASDPGLIPPSFDSTQLPAIVPVCYDDESNTRRRELCQQFFDAEDDEGNKLHDTYY